MGCDIHMVLEKRDPKFGWVGINAFEGHRCQHKDEFCSPVARDRNYRLFAALAGVRGDGPAPRGLPDDASALTKLKVEEWGIDGHSHSWLSLADATREFNARRYPHGETPVDPASYRDLYPADYWFGIGAEDQVDEHRLIFWFDN